MQTLSRQGRGTRRGMRRFLFALTFLSLIAGPVGMPGIAQAADPTITSDQADYPPGATVTLTGANWMPGETVQIVVDDAIGKTWQWDCATRTDAPCPVADAAGGFTYRLQLSSNFVAEYGVTATGLTSGLVATTTFTDANPSADLDQCANDPAPSPSTDGCSSSASDWVNGNLGASKAVYFEGDSIPYRMRFDNLSTTGSHTVTIEWDTTKSGKHAIDYLTSFDRTVATADPCLGVSGCGSPTTFAIPADPQVTGGGVTPVAGNFTLYGGTITSVSAYSYPNGSGFAGDKSARITISFTASQANPVLAWGGHISSRADWGANNSAVAIPGSPYHMRLIDLDGQGGNQDRSLSADAVIFPASITIIKDATPNGSTSFPFTASPSPLTNFALVDDGTSANTKVFSNITNFQTYTISETTPSGWSLAGIVCSVTSPNGGSQTVNLPSVSINLKEGENVTCTFSNSQQTGTLIVKKHVVNDDGGTAVAGNWSLHVKSGSSDVSGSPQAGSESGTSYTLPVGSYTVSETDGPSGYTGPTFSGDCDSGGSVTVVAGQTKTCTLTNNDQAAHLKLVKTVVNDNGGTASATDWTLSASGPTPISGAGGAESDVDAGKYDLSESGGPSGYTSGSWVCVGGTQIGASVTLANGESATCTITNDDQAATLTVIKHVVNDNGGNATADEWSIHVKASGSDVSGSPQAGDESGTVYVLPAGTYGISESGGPAGYSGPTFSGDCDSSGSITLKNGDSLTCTLTNDDQPAHLKLIKTVTNDDGGTAAATAWTLHASGPSGFSGTTPTESDVNAGVYNLSETGGPSGYTAGTWSCVGGTQTGASVTLDLGESAVCTIDNDDNTPKLKLVKTVTKDDGGTAVPDDWTLSADAAAPNAGRNFNNPGGSGTFNNVFANAEYTLSESGPSGYTAGVWSCVGGTQAGNKITLGLGDQVTCTINNDDQPAHLKLVKAVVNDNGGTATADDWTLSADGPTPISGDGGAEGDVSAGTYALSESTGPAGYTAGAWSCEGGTQNDSSVTLKNGESATCTITNDDQPGTIIIKKVTKPVDSGSFSFTTTGTGYSNFTLQGGQQNSQTLNAGTYTVREQTQLGWILTGIGGSTDPNTPYDCTVTGSGGSTGVGDPNTQTATINLKNGDTVTCVFENTGQGVTRTQGFWATHPQLANIAWFGGTAFGHTFPGVANTAGIGDTTLCGRSIDTLGKLMGGFWSDISKKSTGAKRSALDQARMQLLQQLLAAELNASAFGSVPSGGTSKFAAWESAYCGTNTNAIKNAQQQAASFNTQGDSSTFTPGTSADSKTARSTANRLFWDVLP